MSKREREGNDTVTFFFLSQAIDAVSEPQDHNPMDVFVLFVLYSLPTRRKSIETMFANKIKSGSFSEDLMAKVFGVHAGVYMLFPAPYRLLYS